MSAESVRLFTAFAVVGLDFGSIAKAPAANLASKSYFRVRYLYPKNDVTIRLSRSICEFGFPENPHELFNLRQDLSRSAYYTFLLTNEDGTKLYGHCLRTFPLGPKKRHDVGRRHPECLCFLSRTHHRSFFEALLSVAAYCRWYVNLPTLIKRLEQIKVPDAYVGSYILPRPLDLISQLPPLLPVLTAFTGQQVLQIVASLLTERSMIFVSSRINRISPTIFAALSLLYPFQWQNILLPVMGDRHINVAFSPTPFVLGMLRYQYDQLMQSGMPLESVVVADIDRSTVTLVGDTDRVARHGLDASIPTIGDSGQVFGIGNMSSKHGTFNSLRLRTDVLSFMAQGDGEKVVSGTLLALQSTFNSLVRRSSNRRLQAAAAAGAATASPTGNQSMKDGPHRVNDTENNAGSPRVESDRRGNRGCGALLDERAFRVSFLSFFVRVFRHVSNFARKSSARQAGPKGVKQPMLDIDRFVQATPDPHLRGLVRHMGSTLLLQHFLQMTNGGRESGSGPKHASSAQSLRYFVDGVNHENARDVMGAWYQLFFDAVNATNERMNWGDTKTAVGSVLSDAAQRKINRIRALVARLANGLNFAEMSQSDQVQRRTDSRFLHKSSYCFENCHATLDALFHGLVDRTNELGQALATSGAPTTGLTVKQQEKLDKRSEKQERSEKLERLLRQVLQTVQAIRGLVLTGNSFVVAQSCFRLRTLRLVITAHRSLRAGGGTLSGRIVEDLVSLYKLLEDKVALDRARAFEKKNTASTRKDVNSGRRLPLRSYRAPFAKLHRECHHPKFARPFRSKSNCLPSARRRGTESSIVPDETIGGKNGLPVLHYIRGPGSESDDDDALFAAAAAEVQQRFIEHESKSQSTAQPSAVQQNENSIAGGDKSTASGSTGEILSLDDLFSAAASNTAVSAPAPAPAPGPALSPAPSPAPFDYFSATSNMPDSPLLESDNSIPHSLGMQAATGSRLNLHMPSGSSSAPPRGSPMQQEMWRQQQLAQQRYQQTLQQQMMQQSQAGRIDLAFGRRQ